MSAVAEAQAAKAVVLGLHGWALNPGKAAVRGCRPVRISAFLLSDGRDGLASEAGAALAS